MMTKKMEVNTCPDSSKKKIQITKDIFWPVRIGYHYYCMVKVIECVSELTRV